MNTGKRLFFVFCGLVMSVILLFVSHSRYPGGHSGDIPRLLTHWDGGPEDWLAVVLSLGVSIWVAAVIWQGTKNDIDI